MKLHRTPHSQTSKSSFLLLSLACCLALALPTLAQAQSNLSGERSDAPHTPQANGLDNLPRLGLEALNIGQVLEEDSQSGVGFVRIAMEWANIEPVYTDTAHFNWSYYDSLYADLAAHNLTPLVLVQKCPAWACQIPIGPIFDDKYDEFGDFIAAVAMRYSQPPYNAHFYEFWNEPDATIGTNREFGWGMHPDKYARMLSEAYTAIKAVDPESVVMMGGLAYDLWFNQGGPFNPDFLAGVLDNGGAQYLDAVAFHYYTNNAHGWTNIRLKAIDFRAEMNAHGADLPMIVTESGLTSSPDFGSSEAKQARHVAQMITQAAASNILAVAWFMDRDAIFPDPGTEVFAHSGLLRTNNSPKPSYTAMQTLSEEIGSGAFLYQLGPADGLTGALEGYRFRSADDLRQVSIVWNNQQEPVVMSIPASQASDLRRAVSLQGQEVQTLPGPDGTRLVTVGLDPIYIEWNSLFSDVTVGSTFYPYVMCLVGQNVISGYSDGTFRPSNNVTRGQTAKVVSNSAGFTETVTIQTFEDVPPGSTFYDFVGRLASRGYVGGYQCGGDGEPCNPPDNLPYFRPNANVTRGQVAKIVSESASYNDVPTNQQFEDVPPNSTFYPYVYRLAIRSIMQGYLCGAPTEPCNPPNNLPYFRPSNTATRAQASKIVANTFFPTCPAQRNVKR